MAPCCHLLAVVIIASMSLFPKGFGSFQSLPPVRLFATPWTAVLEAGRGYDVFLGRKTNSDSLTEAQG